MSLKKDTFKLRPAVEEDATVIRSLVVEGQINPTGLDWKRFIVAVVPGSDVIGCGQIKPHRDGSHELASIAVTPDWQGRGVACAIVEHLLASKDGVLYLMCQSSLGPLYAKFGFRAVEEDDMPKYFRRVSKLAGLAEVLLSRGETLLVMRRL